jgi:hypothetical protein
VKASSAPRAAAMPALRARPSPVRGSLTIVTGTSSVRTRDSKRGAVSSVDPLSTTTNSHDARARILAIESKNAASLPLRLRVQTMSERSGASDRVSASLT